MSGIEKTSMPDHPWELSGADPHGSGVVLARTLGDARAFLSEIDAHVDREAERRSIEELVRPLERLALGHAVRFEREQRDMSSAALAAESGVAATRVEALEAGRLEMDYVTLVRLARALGLGTDCSASRTTGCRRSGAWAERRSVQDADAALLALHRYLFPERYAEVPTYEWHAGTIEEVAEILERALANHPDARLEPR